MIFDITIGNPPYNNDMYINFIELGIKVSKDNCIMVTPAKWQAKPNAQNSEFRRNIVPYMKKIVYYPDTGDVFDIRLQGGISYFITDKVKHDCLLIKNICSRVKAFDSLGKFEERNIYSNSDKYNSLCDKLMIDCNTKYDICKKVGVFESNFESLSIGANAVYDNYNVFVSSLNADSGGSQTFHTYSSTGSLTMMPPLEIVKNAVPKSADTMCMFTTSNRSEAENFVSYINTKFVRFMLLMRYCMYHNNNNGCWVFVPRPIKFDHKFTDEELYVKYGLTDNEINVIESVIVGR